MRLSDLQNKNIVNIVDGKNIGNIIDVHINEASGNIESFVIERLQFVYLFLKIAMFSCCVICLLI